MESKLPPGFKEEHNIVYGITDNGLLHIKLNRPEKKNALYPEMYEVIRTQV
jgi:enoyl-CoA hydratase/carnithine racemase